MKIRLNGSIPSKKNSRITSRKTGRSFPSKRYTEWHKDATEQLERQGVPKNKYKMLEDVLVVFQAPDNRKFDLSNKFESIADLLVDYGFIEDDNYSVLPMVTLAFEGVFKEEPGCDIYISEDAEEMLNEIRDFIIR